MDPRIAAYLDLSYRRDVLGENVSPEHVLQSDAAYMTALQAELKRIYAICRRREDLQQRDFAAYHHGRAIERALAQLGKSVDAPQ